MRISIGDEFTTPDKETIILIFSDTVNFKYPNNMAKATPHYDSISSVEENQWKSKADINKEKRAEEKKRKAEPPPPPQVFVVMKPPRGVTSQGKFWIFEIGRQTWSVTKELAQPGEKGKESINTGDIMYPCRFWPTLQSQHVSSTKNFNAPDPNPAPTPERIYNCTPTTELADYESSNLHYIPSDKYTINTEATICHLVDRAYTQTLDISNEHILEALSSPPISVTPLPSSVQFPSDRQSKEMCDINDIGCEQCGKNSKKVNVIKCDAIGCGKAYCAKCLNMKKFPPAWLVWDPIREKKANPQRENCQI
jgi:hypothetical protein